MRVGTPCAHPFRGWQAGRGEDAYGYEFDVPVMAGGFVTTDAGTGIVHIAPSHGRDDFELGREHGLPVTGQRLAIGWHSCSCAQLRHTCISMISDIPVQKPGRRGTRDE